MRLREEVSCLLHGGKVRKKKCPNKVVTANEVESNLKILRPLMKNWIADNENSTLVVTIKRSGASNCDTQIWQQLTKPNNLSSGGRHSNVFCLGGGKSSLLLLLTLLIDKRVS